MRKTEFSATEDSAGLAVMWCVDPEVHFPTQLPDFPAFPHSGRKASFVFLLEPGDRACVAVR